MNALRDLFGSERGFFALLLVVAATVLAALGKMTTDQWQSFAIWIFGIYVGGKTVTGAVDVIKNGSAPAPAPTDGGKA